MKGDAIAEQNLVVEKLKGSKATRDPNAPKKSRYLDAGFIAVFQ